MFSSTRTRLCASLAVCRSTCGNYPYVSAALVARVDNGGEGVCDGCDSRWNEAIVAALVDGSKKALVSCGVAEADVHVHTVPGSYELPFAARSLLAKGDGKGKKYDAVICIGVLIKGDTMHFEYICEAVTQGITRVGLDTGKPVIFGVLTCLTDQQALKRAGLTPDGHNHGTDWGLAAVEMAKYRFTPSKL